MRVFFTISTAMALVLATATPLIAAPSGSSSIVISEFRTRGPNGANDEFIELYNRANYTVDIGGWKIMRSSASGATSVVTQIAANTIVPAGGFFLLTNTGTQGYSGTVPPNATYTRSIDDLGGIAVADGSGTIIDQVGLGAGSAYLEGAALAPMLTNVNQSHERNFGGCFPSQDNDNNATDFRYNGSSSYPQNSLTNCAGGCTDVVCLAPLDAQCWNSPGQCVNGSCSYEQRPENTPCSDNSVCTQGDACDVSGLCQSGPTLPCNTPPSPYCSDPQTLVAYAASGTCDDANGGCVYAELAPQNCAYGCNGVTKACNPNPCDSVSCNGPPTDCYLSNGTCDNGLCIYTPKSGLSPCEDGDLCTTGDSCDGSGTCVTGTAVLVDDGNPCTADACDKTTGVVSHTHLGDGTSCDDLNLCNGIETCQSGTCTQGTETKCKTPPAGGCVLSEGTCAPSTGICTYQPLGQGTDCNDGDLCTIGDQCDGNGACTGSTKLCPTFSTCTDSSTSQLNWSGSCDANTGNCAYSQRNTTCTVGCDSASGLCNLDPCDGVTCNDPPTNCHIATGTCSGNGVCSYSLKPAGASCDDAQACTSVDQCSAAGACQGVPIACNTPPAAATCFSSTVSRSYDVNGACLTVSGLCNYTYTDTTCPHGCNSGTGLCADDPCATKTCDQPPTQCHKDLGTCTNGTCQYALKDANSLCDDANVCTENDVCSNTGTCVGTPIVCNNPPNSTCTNSTSRVYNVNGTCNSLGVCTYSYVDAPCTADCNTTTGVCNEDLCALVTCNQPEGPCMADQGTCNQGTCTYAAKPASVTCNDGDACTGNDVCDGSGHCSGTTVSNCGTGGTSGTGGNSGTGGLSSTGGIAATGGTLAATGGTLAAAGGTLAASGGIAATGGALAATGGIDPTGTGGNLATGGVLAVSSGGTATTSIPDATGGLLAIGGTQSLGGSASTGGETTSAAGGTSIGGESATGGTSALASLGGNTGAGTSSTGGSKAVAGASQAAGANTVAGTTGTGTSPDIADSVQNGGCNCSVPRRSNGASWALALAALVLWRRRRKQ